MRHTHSNSLKDKINKKLCQWYGHQWVDGLKFHNHKMKGESKVCLRCGIYETVTKPTVESSV